MSKTKKTVLVDLDGVLTDYSKGWQGIENIGDPLPGAKEFVADLRKFARVVIYTTRCKVYPQGTPGPIYHAAAYDTALARASFLCGE